MESESWKSDSSSFAKNGVLIGSRRIWSRWPYVDIRRIRPVTNALFHTLKFASAYFANDIAFKSRGKVNFTSNGTILPVAARTTWATAESGCVQPICIHDCFRNIQALNDRIPLLDLLSNSARSFGSSRCFTLVTARGGDKRMFCNREKAAIWQSGISFFVYYWCGLIEMNFIERITRLLSFCNCFDSFITLLLLHSCV